MSDDFFEQEFCDRCRSELTGRTMSWFNDDVICIKCTAWEDRIISERPESKSQLESIGSIPDVDIDVQWGTKLPEHRNNK